MGVDLTVVLGHYLCILYFESMRQVDPTPSNSDHAEEW